MCQKTQKHLKHLKQSTITNSPPLPTTKPNRPPTNGQIRPPTTRNLMCPQPPMTPMDISNPCNPLQQQTHPTTYHRTQSIIASQPHTIEDTSFCTLTTQAPFPQ